MNETNLAPPFGQHSHGMDFLGNLRVRTPEQTYYMSACRCGWHSPEAASLEDAFQAWFGHRHGAIGRGTYHGIHEHASGIPCFGGPGTRADCEVTYARD